MRRKYFNGRCDDCARYRRVTRIYFWVNNMPYTMCSECIRMYRKQILDPCKPGCAHCEKAATR